MLNTLGSVAYVCDGDMGDFFEGQVLPKLNQHTETELWVLAGMLCGHACRENAEIVAGYAGIVASLSAGQPAPDPVVWWRKKKAERIAAYADKAANPLPF